MTKKYNVYIIEDKNNKAVQIIGKDMSERNADKREMTGLCRIDTSNYCVMAFEVGTKQDLHYQENLEKQS